jgi:hypothetical protein
MARGLRITLSVSLPAWRTAMSVNTRIDLALNTQEDVHPAENEDLNPLYPGDAPWRGTSLHSQPGYSTANVAPDLGTHGSILYAAGGHNAYWGNELWRFDVGTRLFSCMSDPYGSFSHPGSFYQDGSQGNQHGDNVNGELFIDGSPAFTTDPNQPGAYQGYSTNVVIPADAGVTGVGAHGAFISPVRNARTPAGDATNGTGTGRAHIFDLAQSDRATAVWERFSTNISTFYGTGRIGWGCFDPTRKKIFCGIASNYGDKLSVIDCSGATAFWGDQIQLTSDGNIQGVGSGTIYMYQHANAFHWAANPDYIIMFKGGSGFYADIVTGRPMLILINVSTGECFAPDLSGALMPKNQGGSTWVESAQKLAFYDGCDTELDVGSPTLGFPNRVWIITPSSTSDPEVFTTTPWTETYEDVTGPTPPEQSQGIPHAGRFLWVESVQCFIWWANGEDTVQAWVVEGFGD